MVTRKYNSPGLGPEAKYWDEPGYWRRVFDALPHLRANLRGAELIAALLDGAEPTAEDLRELWDIAEAFEKPLTQGSVHVQHSAPADFRQAIRDAIESARVLKSAEIESLKAKDAPQYGEPGFKSVLSEFED